MKHFSFSWTHLSKTSTGERDGVGEPATPKPCWYCGGWWYGRNPKLLMALPVPFPSPLLIGGDPPRSGELFCVVLSFLRLRFSGATESSGAESTSRSDSGELGGPLRVGESFIGRENKPVFSRGLLGDDSDPVSWSVSVDSRCRLDPVQEETIKLHLTKKFPHSIARPVGIMEVAIKTSSPA